MKKISFQILRFIGFFILFLWCVKSTFGEERSRCIIISINPEFHMDYGFSYPLTYKFKIPSGNFDIRVNKKYEALNEWIQIAEKTSNDFFNGIGVVRFDYADETAYVSVAFNYSSDKIYLQFIDTTGDIIPVTYQGICKYYDNRDAVVTSSADDWGNGHNDAFIRACEAFRSAHIWVSIGIITGSVNSNSWSSIQEQIDLGYVEAASHSLTHPDWTEDERPGHLPWDKDIPDTETQIRESKDNIIDNLNLPDVFKRGDQEYLYTFIEPNGHYNSEVRRFLGEYKYLVDRSTHDNVYSFSDWDHFYNLYERVHTSLYLDGYRNTETKGIAKEIGDADLEKLTDDFDSFLENGGIYHVWLHPWAHNWEDGSNVYQYLNHLKEREKVWYVSLGHLYLYHLLQGREGELLHVRAPTESRIKTFQ